MKFDKKGVYSLLIAGIYCTGMIGPTTLFGCSIKSEQDNKLNWDNIKKSYVGLVRVDGEYTTSLLKDNNNGLYEDIINNTIINKNDIIEYYSAVPYFTQTENIKNSYTKEELKEIVKEFKIGSNEYTYSDDYVLMK